MPALRDAGAARGCCGGDAGRRGPQRRRHPHLGWGANIVALLPQGATGIRLAKSAGVPDNSDVDSSGMAQVAEALVKFCDTTGVDTSTNSR